jgi:hypothetical protein
VRKAVQSESATSALPNEMTWPGLYLFLIRAGKIAGGATFIFGVFYGTYQYFEAIKDKRIEQVLATYRQFNLPPISDYRAKVFGVLVKNRLALRDAVADERKLEAVVIGLVEQNDMEKELLLLMDFYEGLVSCVTSKICDETTALNLFYPRALQVYVIFYPYIKDRRQDSSKFGDGLERLALTNFK